MRDRRLNIALLSPILKVWPREFDNQLRHSVFPPIYWVCTQTFFALWARRNGTADLETSFGQCASWFFSPLFHRQGFACKTVATMYVRTFIFLFVQNAFIARILSNAWILEPVLPNVWRLEQIRRNFRINKLPGFLFRTDAQSSDTNEKFCIADWI